MRGTLKNPHCRMTMSAEQRSKFAIVQRQWWSWRLNMSKNFSSGTKNHEQPKNIIIHIIRSSFWRSFYDNISLIIFFINRNKAQSQIQIACKPCFRDTINAEATKCCKTCENPEPLCERCAKRHTLMKGNSEHEMTTDFHQFLQPYSR